MSVTGEQLRTTQQKVMEGKMNEKEVLANILGILGSMYNERNEDRQVQAKYNKDTLDTLHSIQEEIKKINDISYRVNTFEKEHIALAKEVETIDQKLTTQWEKIDIRINRMTIMTIVSLIISSLALTAKVADIFKFIP